jgi:hypothetical protein
MPIQARVLDAALRLCRGRGGWTFRPAEIVAALPDLNAASVRTHVMSRCCINAPPHHSHRWPYFRRTDRGVYQILPALRERRPQVPLAAGRPPGTAPGPAQRGPGETLLSVEIRESGGRYVAGSTALDSAVEGASLESVLSRVVRLAREKLESRGGAPVRLSAELRLQVRPRPGPPDPLVAAYVKDIDRTLIRENLRLSVEERLEELQHWVEATDEIRGVARRSRRGTGQT